MSNPVSPSGGNDTPVLQSLLNAGGSVRLTDGTFRLTSLTMPNSLTSLVGVGREATTLLFPYPYNVPCVKVGVGNGSDVVLNRIAGLSITTPAANGATAIQVLGASEFTLEDVGVYRWQGNSNSVALDLRGHNAGTVNNCTFEADAPISIGLNPNSPYPPHTKDDLDHVVFRDLYALARSLNPIVKVASGAAVQNFLFEGRQSWVGGSAGIEWVDRLCQQIGFTLALNNVRWEQSIAAQGWMVDLQHNHSLQGVSIANCRNERGNGIRLRNCLGITLCNYFYGATGTGLDADQCDTLVLAGDNYFQTGSKVSIGKNVKRQRGRYTQGNTEVVVG